MQGDYTTAYFSLSGKTCIVIDLVKIKARGLLIWFPHNFNILVQIQSQPDEFLDFRELIILLMSPSVIGNICMGFQVQLDNISLAMIQDYSL
jgi:hypothetical protein